MTSIDDYDGFSLSRLTSGTHAYECLKKNENVNIDLSFSLIVVELLCSLI